MENNIDVKALLEFADTIQSLDPVECDGVAINYINFIEQNNLDINDYGYLQFYASFNGLLDENNRLREEFREEKIEEKQILKENTILTEATKSKREEIVKFILDCMSIIDRSKLNVNKYRDMFESMSDDEFSKWMDKFLADPDANFYLELLPNKSEPTIYDIEKLLAKLGIPKEEYVYYRDNGFKDDPLRSRERCAVGYVTVRRLQQILSKKNTYSLDIDSRNVKTGQVSGSDKIARISDSELYALTIFGADAAIKEFYSARADNMVAKSDMYSKISKYGYVYLDELSSDRSKNQTLNTIDTFMTGAGIKTDLMGSDKEKAAAALKKQFVNDELKKMNLVKEEVELSEDKILSKDNIEIGLEDWNGDNNILYITGLGGSGKSTIIKEYGAKYNAECLEFDAITSALIKGLENLNRNKIHPIIIEYLETQKPEKLNGFSDPNFDKECVAFLDWFENKVKGDGKLYALEGMQIFLCFEPERFKGKPMVIMGTSAIKSWYRSNTRNFKSNKDVKAKFKFFLKSFKRIKLVMKNDDQINHLIEVLNEESSIDEADRVLQQTDKSVRVPDANTESENTLNYYVVYPTNCDGKTLSPRVPNNYMTKNKYEDWQTPRVCASSSIGGCLKALSRNLKDERLYVHKIVSNENPITPSPNRVPDAHLTGEVWFKFPVTLKCVGQIYVIGDDGKPGQAYKYGDNKTGKLYGWNFKWERKFGEQPQQVQEDTKEYVYIAVTEEEVKRGYIDYPLQENCNGKYVNLTLEGLESFLEAMNVNEYDYYIKVPKECVDIAVYDEETEGAVIRLPFAHDIDNYKNLNKKGVR